MQFTVEQSQLQNVLSQAQRFVSGKALSPTLAGILFTVNAEASTLIVRAAHTQAQYQTTLAVTNAVTGSYVLPASVVTSAVKAFDAGPVTFQVEGDTILASQKKLKYTLSPLPPDEFPGAPSIEGHEIVFPRESFLKTCEIVSVAASKDETKPVLTSVLLEMTAPNAVVTSDGFRLFRHEVDLSLDLPKTLLIPSRPLKEVLSLMKSIEEPVITARWQEESGQLVFVVGSTVVQVSLVSGDFPPYRNIIPEATSFSLTLDRELLLQRLQQIMVMARELSSIVIFQPVAGPDGMELEVSSQAGVRGASSGSVSVLQVEGDVPRFACNGTYIMDFLSAVDSQDIVIQGNDPLKPILFSVPGRTDILGLAMPFKLQQ